MSREGEDRPGQPSETLAEPQDERNRFPGLRVPGEQEPVCHGPESDHLNRRENRGGQRGKRKRRPRPRLEGRGEAGESNDIAPIPCEGGEGREGEHEGHESEEPETPGALFARLRGGHDLHAGGLVGTRLWDPRFDHGRWRRECLGSGRLNHDHRGRDGGRHRRRRRR